MDILNSSTEAPIAAQGVFDRMVQAKEPNRRGRNVRRTPPRVRVDARVFRATTPGIIHLHLIDYRLAENCDESDLLRPERVLDLRQRGVSFGRALHLSRA